LLWHTTLSNIFQKISVPQELVEDAQSVAVSGFEFKVTAKTQMVEDKTETVTIIANETCLTFTMIITVKKATTATI
jgi:predicted nucleotidyltransferase